MYKFYNSFNSRHIAHTTQIPKFWLSGGLGRESRLDRRLLLGTSGADLRFRLQFFYSARRHRAKVSALPLITRAVTSRV